MCVLIPWLSLVWALKYSALIPESLGLSQDTTSVCSDVSFLH